jgi:GrpB-like predicted nucleotidyltransferase (UPF0157 family)
MAVKVTIVDYNPIWPELFEREKGKLLVAVGDYVLDIQHVGSTAVPGLAAKPVIDIMIGVRALAEADAACIKPIVQLGYEYVQAFETMMPFRRYFRRDNPDGVRTHQIHLVEKESEFWQRHLAFRDYLRSHQEARAAYEQIKRDLAVQEWETVNDYAAAKTDFIRTIEAKALAEWQS